MRVHSFIILVSCFVYFGCAGSVRISLAGRVIYFLCGTPLCGVPGRYNFIWALLRVDGGTVQIFSFLWLCCSGYGTVEMVGGGLSFFSFSSVCCQLSWRAVVCGRILFFYIGFSWLYSGTICGFVFYKLLILSYLLQMVEEEYGPGSL